MFKIYVGNLSFDSNEDEVRTLFEEHGEVLSVNFITDRDTGRPRGFGFVEMADANQGRTAIEQINGREVGGRRPMATKSPATCSSSTPIISNGWPS